MSDSPLPVNTPVSQYELLARNIYETSQYSSSKGLKKNRFYPNYRKESRDFKGRHVCRVSLQRICYAKWSGAAEYAMKTKNEKQRLVGFEFAPAFIATQHGFTLEPAAHIGNPYHAHIYFKEIDFPYPQKDEQFDEVMNSGLRRRIDEMTSQFKFITLQEIESVVKGISTDSDSCEYCLYGQ